MRVGPRLSLLLSASRVEVVGLAGTLAGPAVNVGDAVAALVLGRLRASSACLMSGEDSRAAASAEVKLVAVRATCKHDSEQARRQRMRANAQCNWRTSTNRHT